MDNQQNDMTLIVNRDMIEEERNYSPTRLDPDIDEPWINSLPEQYKNEIFDCIRFIHEFQDHRKELLKEIDLLSIETDSDKIYDLTLEKFGTEAIIVSLQDSVLRARLLPPYESFE